MSKPRLFFSHSTEDGSSDRAILMSLEEALKADYEILLDRTALVAGGDWRSTINAWIGTCDAAVILVTPESIASDYCNYEWAILSFRRKEDSLLIIPIYYGTAPEAIKGRAAQINEISGHFNFDNINNVTRKVRERLVAEIGLKKERHQMTILYVVKTLKDAVGFEEVIETAAGKINLDLGTWDISSDKWFKFAVKIMGVGIGRAWPVLRDLQHFFGGANEEKFGDLVDLIGFCSWVDLGSAHRIKGCALRAAATQDPLGLNAEEVKTAKGYVLSASERGPRNNWPIGTAHAVFASYEDLTRRVQSALREALDLEDGADDAKLKKYLEARLKGEPVFVVLRAEGLNTDWLTQLRKLFAGVTFLILTGETGTTSDLIPDDAWLKPLLPSGYEHEIWDDYDTARQFLRIA
jgi:TIR domain